MKYKVVGIDKESGLETELMIEAPSVRDATVLARLKGCHVQDVREFTPRSSLARHQLTTLQIVLGTLGGVILGGIVMAGLFIALGRSGDAAHDDAIAKVTEAQESGKDAAPASTVRASAFILVDAQGRTRGELKVTPDGPGLMFCDENGKPRAMLTAFKDGPGLTLGDENGEPRAMLTAFKDMPGLTLRDENGEPRAMLTAFKDMPGLTLRDENGRSRVAMTATNAGAAMGLIDENGKPRATLTVTKDGSVFGLMDANGTVRAKLGIAQTITADGKTITYPESSLLLFGPDGMVRWSAQ